MSDLHKDILIGTLFIIGLVGFISGEFTISSALFATAAIASNVNLYRKKGKAGQFSCDWCSYLNCLTMRLEAFQDLTALEGFLFLCSLASPFI